MLQKVYLTIDDTPSARTDDILNFLKAKNIQALFFVRGDLLRANAAPVTRAIKEGHLIGNHTYSHRRASTLSPHQVIEDIEKCDALIEDAYASADVTRPGKYFRFPHMDRGAAGWIVDYNAVPSHKETLLTLFSDGLNLDLTAPAADDIARKDMLQFYLKREGYHQPFANVTLPWFAQTEMAEAADCMFTFSNSDWMITQRHLQNNWPYKTLDDLKTKIDDDPYLGDASTHHIVLMHDQDETAETMIALTDYMLHNNFEFLQY